MLLPYTCSIATEVDWKIYQRFPVLVDEETGTNPWGVTFLRMFDMASDSGMFRTRQFLEESGHELRGNVFCCEGGESYLPLYEAKMIHQFDHRYATYEIDGTIRDTTLEEHQDPTFAPMSRYWVSESEVEARLAGRDQGFRWQPPWLLGFRDIARSTDERTAIFTLIPFVGVGHTMPVCLLDTKSTDRALYLAALTSSFAFDYVTRQAVGGTHLTYFILRQLPVPDPLRLEAIGIEWVANRAAELTATDSVMNAALGGAMALCSWDPEDRLESRAELDAYFMCLYGISSEDAEYILETFGGTKHRECREWGSFRTKRLVLQAMSTKPWERY